MNKRNVHDDHEQRSRKGKRLLEIRQLDAFTWKHGKGWRHPFVGFLISSLLAGFTLLCFFWEGQHLHALSFPGTLIVLQVIAVALMWGLAPALLSVLLNILILDATSLSVRQESSLGNWDSMLPLLACTVILAVVISRYEAVRLRAQLQQQYEHERANDLEQLNQLKDQFLAMASHELKTPITVIRTQAQLSLRSLQKHSFGIPDQEQRIRSGLEYIERQTSRIRKLVDDLLDLANIRAGKIHLDPSRCDLGGICNEVVQEQHMLAEKRAIIFEEPEEPVVLSVDQPRICQVITNLLSNALKYSPKESAVRLRVGIRGQMAVITVSNHGEGIAQEDLALIFEPFYRTVHAKASSQEGTGLGLAIAKSIVEQHHGHLWCESTPREETVFFVELPLGSREGGYQT